MKTKRQTFIVIKQIPVSLNRLYQPICKRKADGKVYPSIIKSADAKKFTTIVHMEAMKQKCINIIDADVKMMVDFCYKGKRSRDIDNVLKLLLDSLNGVMYKDDSQIVELTIRKHKDQVEDEIVVMVEEVID